MKQLVYQVSITGDDDKVNNFIFKTKEEISTKLSISIPVINSIISERVKKYKNITITKVSNPSLTEDKVVEDRKNKQKEYNIRFRQKIKEYKQEHADEIKKTKEDKLRKETAKLMLEKLL